MLLVFFFQGSNNRRFQELKESQKQGHLFPGLFLAFSDTMPTNNEGEENTPHTSCFVLGAKTTAKSPSVCASQSLAHTGKAGRESERGEREEKEGRGIEKQKRGKRKVERQRE